MTEHDGSRFKKTELSPRQLKQFDRMYLDRSYTMADIQERFGIGASTIARLANERNLSMRVPGKRP